MQQLSLLAAVLLAAAAPSSCAALASCSPAGPQDCSTLLNKLPVITAEVAPPGSPPAATAALSPTQRRAFEHLLGHALRDTPAVAWATREFAKRMKAFLVGGAALNNTTADDALKAAFISSKCDAGNTGWVGPSLPAIKEALEFGNLREVWGLMYVLSKTHYVTELMLALLNPRAAGEPPLATPASLAARFGTSEAEVAERHALVMATKALNDSSLEYGQGMPDFEYEAYASWVRMDFSSIDHKGDTLWGPARSNKPAGCGTVPYMSNDPSIEPPLSAAELAYQCAGEKTPCKLKWKPGALCYDLPNTSWTLPSPPEAADASAAGSSSSSSSSGGQVVAGLNERAAKLGYRSAAAASGTTANMLQLAKLLGFAADELVILRAAMAAWMLVTDDHSFFEIMLGGEAYVAPPYRMAMGLHDLGQMWPPNATLRTQGGDSFSAVDVWSRVGERLATPAGSALLAAMDKTSKAYVTSLIAAGSNGEEVERSSPELK